VVGKNARGVDHLLRKNGVDTVHGRGRLRSASEVEVLNDEGSTVYTADHVLLATGSVPAEIPVAPSDGRLILTSDDALRMNRIPRNVAVLGGGAVGVEFASIYRSFGAEVSLIELLPHLLPNEDVDVSVQLERSLRRRGIQLFLGSRLDGVEKRGDTVALRLEGEEESSILETECLLVAVGRKPVTSDLGLEALGVELDRGRVVVDSMMRTNVPGVYAIGDLVPTPWLAHVASAEGIVVAEHIAAKESGAEVHGVDYRHIPSCTYCRPEVASVGMTEAEAREQGYEVSVGTFPFQASGKAAILGSTEGFVKLVRESRYDEVLGVHIIGPHATDLIAEACVALRLESTTEEIVRAVHAHPTLSEAVAEAAHAALGAAIHI
ncbi:MAG: dihydrolipoyl dehydrogenase, partial [Acidobacteriota bacterium]